MTLDDFFATLTGTAVGSAWGPQGALLGFLAGLWLDARRLRLP